MYKRRNIFLLVVILLLAINGQGIKAKNVLDNNSNVKLEGKAEGIIFIPGEDPFLYAPNMLPGDKLYGRIDLDNNHDIPYELYMRAERVTAKEKYDLLKVLNLKLIYKDEILYEGPVSGEDGMVNNIYLGEINPNERESIKAEVFLQGSATGNEYKNKLGQVDWIFTAVNVSKDQEDNTEREFDNKKLDEGIVEKVINKIHTLPQTGKDIVLVYGALGIAILVAGIILVTKGGQSNEKKSS